MQLHFKWNLLTFAHTYAGEEQVTRAAKDINQIDAPFSLCTGQSVNGVYMRVGVVVINCCSLPLTCANID